jgi:hypothetical protein
MKCELGDIVLVNNYQYTDGREGSYHNFVIAEIDEDEFTLVHLDYFGFIVSSQISKNSDINKAFPYNEPISSDDINRLPKSSHVKCDELINVKPNNIIMKLGTVTVEQYAKFMQLYAQYLREKLKSDSK